MTLDPTKPRNPSPDNDCTPVQWQTGDKREDKIEDKNEGSEYVNDRASGSERDVETDQPTRSESPI